MQQQQKKDFVDSFYPKVNHEKNVAFMEKNKLLPITSSITSESFSLPGSTLLWTTYSSLLEPCEITEHVWQTPSQVA